MEIKISNRKIGDGHPVFFIAEAGVNHNGSSTLGKKLIDAAVDAGADAVKFQTFKAEELNTVSAPKSTYHIETTGIDSKQSWFELLKTQEISREMHIELMDYCRKKKILFLSTPYGKNSADLLEELGVPAFKIASTDTNNIPFLEDIAKKSIPTIISTAMSTMEEVETAVSTFRKAKLQEYAVLQCTGNYPCNLGSSNLKVMQTYRENLNCLVGYSDHTTDIINPVAATAMGACIFEKHFTLDKTLPGPDHRMSLDPKELKLTVDLIRKTELSMGSAEKKVLSEEEENRKKLRKSIVAISNIPKETRLTREMLGIKRPGYGISPSKLDMLIGKITKIQIKKDDLLNFDSVE